MVEEKDYLNHHTSRSEKKKRAQSKIFKTCSGNHLKEVNILKP